MGAVCEHEELSGTDPGPGLYYLTYVDRKEHQRTRTDSDRDHRGVGVLHSQLPFPPFTIGERHPIDALLIAIVIGMLVRNTLSLSPSLSPGIKFSVKKVLPFAIVLMGAKLDFNYIMEVSAQALLISVICVVVALALTLWLCNRVGSDGNWGC